jgi:hypothetical protein
MYVHIYTHTYDLLGIRMLYPVYPIDAGSLENANIVLYTKLGRMGAGHGGTYL